MVLGLEAASLKALDRRRQLVLFRLRVGQFMPKILMGAMVQVLVRDHVAAGVLVLVM
jgi:hypothetical protein